MLFVSTDVLVVYLWRLRRAEAPKARAAARCDGGRPAVSEMPAAPPGRLGRDRARRARVLRRRAAAARCARSVPVVSSRCSALPAGAFAVARRREAARLGRDRVAALVGIAGGIAATRSGEATSSEVVVWGALLASTLRYATPLMLRRARRAVLRARRRDQHRARGDDADRRVLRRVGRGRHRLVGRRASSSRCVAGALFALIHARLRVSLRADQIVSGTALNLLALGITGYLYVDIYGKQGTPDNLPGVPDIKLPIKSIPLLGDVFGQLNLLVWLALALVVVTWVVVFRTTAGLRLRSAGENPLAAETAGLSVVRTRYLAVMASGALAALGGAFLSIGFVHSFTQNMTAGRGFIALAALIFGRWRPGGALAATLLFGFGSALAQRLPVVLAVGRGAVPGAAVRADADRGHRASSAARSRRPRSGARCRVPEFRAARVRSSGHDAPLSRRRAAGARAGRLRLGRRPDRFDLHTPGAHTGGSPRPRSRRRPPRPPRRSRRPRRRRPRSRATRSGSSRAGRTRCATGTSPPRRATSPCRRWRSTTSSCSSRAGPRSQSSTAGCPAGPSC